MLVPSNSQRCINFHNCKFQNCHSNNDQFAIFFGKTNLHLHTNILKFHLDPMRTRELVGKTGHWDAWIQLTRKFSNLNFSEEGWFRAFWVVSWAIIVLSRIMQLSNFLFSLDLFLSWSNLISTASAAVVLINQSIMIWWLTIVYIYVTYSNYSAVQHFLKCYL